jgi:hypothetical protein
MEVPNHLNRLEPIALSTDSPHKNSLPIKGILMLLMITYLLIKVL